MTKQDYLKLGQEIYDHYEGAFVPSVIAEIIMKRDVGFLEQSARECGDVAFEMLHDADKIKSLIGEAE